MALKSAQVKQLAAHLCAVTDSSMRSRLLTEKIRDLGAEQAAELLQEILVVASREKGEYRLLLEAVNVQLLTASLGNPGMSDIYTAAQDKGYEELTALLSRPEPSRTADDERRELQDDQPCGIRISRARQLRGARLARMFSDPDPRVIRAVLQNPSLTESDVLKLCSRRPASAAIQQEIAESRKWVARYRVKKALVLNPYTPTEIGIRLVHFLLLQDLRLVADSFDIHPALREIAFQKIKEADGL